MICPSCKNEIEDGSIICPVCNTQFAFTVPGQPLTSNPNLYEVVQTSNNMTSLEESAYSPNANALPTEISHYNEEEVRPQGSVINQNINTSQDVSGESYNPDEYHASPLRPEPPSAVALPTNNSNQAINTIQPQQVVVQTNTNAMANSVNNINNAQMNTGNVMLTQQQIPIQTNVVQMPSPENTNDVKKKFKTTDIFFGTVCVVGLIIIVIIVIGLFVNKNNSNGIKTTAAKKGNTHEQVMIESGNVGFRSTFSAPMHVGETTLASIYDSASKTYTDVDVTAIRFIDGVEAAELAKQYAKEVLIEGFTWNVLEYNVKFNDLKYLTAGGISPVLNSQVYLWNGCTYATYNEKKYTLKSYDVYSGGPILNTQSATVKVIYQIPETEKEYSVCLGYKEKTRGCFAK